MKPLQVEAYSSGLRTLAGGSVKLTFDTKEGVNGDVLSYLIQNQEKPGWLSFMARQVEIDDIKDLPMPEVEGKKPSQRLRAVMYVYWEKYEKHNTTFDAFYTSMMERIISKWKDKI